MIDSFLQKWDDIIWNDIVEIVLYGEWFLVVEIKHVFQDLTLAFGWSPM